MRQTTSDEDLQTRVSVTRKRTAAAYAHLARGSVPTALLDVVSALVQRIEDLEDDLGYAAPEFVPDFTSSVDTQGR